MDAMEKARECIAFVEQICVEDPQEAFISFQYALADVRNDFSEEEGEMWLDYVAEHIRHFFSDLSVMDDGSLYLYSKDIEIGELVEDVPGFRAEYYIECSKLFPEQSDIAGLYVV